MNLHTLPARPRRRRRVGRGSGSGLGKTAGRGTKGQKSRSGHHALPVRFEGGQMPLTQRLPKLRGFRNPVGYRQASVTTARLERSSITGTITLAKLQEARVVPRRACQMKVILSGKVSKKLAVQTDRISVGAEKAIEAAGGTVKVTQPAKQPSRPVVRKEPPKSSTAAAPKTP